MAVRQLFDNDNGIIVGFSIIVCEINPWVNREVYDGNMSSELPTYTEVWLLGPYSSKIEGSNTWVQSWHLNPQSMIDAHLAIFDFTV